MGQFKFSMPLQILNKDEKGWKIRGVASTEDEDLQGEIVKQNGLDFSHIKKGLGLFNWNHKNDPQYILGKIEDAKVEKDKTIVEGYLFENQDNAKALVNIMKSLKPEDQRRLQMSIEGKILDRDKDNNKIIKRAKVEKIALTLDAVNPKTYVDLVKSLIANNDDDMFSDIPKSDDGYIAISDEIKDEKQKVEESVKNLEDSLNEVDGDITIKRSKLESLIDDIHKLVKTMTTGNYAGTPDSLKDGGAMQVESLDGQIKDTKKKKEKGEENLVDWEEEEKLMKPAKKALRDEYRDLYKSILFKFKKLHPDVSLQNVCRMTDDFIESRLEKAKYPIGTIRDWKGEKYKKVAEGKWVAVSRGARNRKETDDNKVKRHASDLGESEIPKNQPKTFQQELDQARDQYKDWTVEQHEEAIKELEDPKLSKYMTPKMAKFILSIHDALSQEKQSEGLGAEEEMQQARDQYKDWTPEQHEQMIEDIKGPVLSPLLSKKAAEELLQMHIDLLKEKKQQKK